MAERRSVSKPKKVDFPELKTGNNSKPNFSKLLPILTMSNSQKSIRTGT